MAQVDEIDIPSHYRTIEYGKYSRNKLTVKLLGMKWGKHDKSVGAL